MSGLKKSSKPDHDILIKLNEDINRHEINRDQNAVDFFDKHLHSDLAFFRSKPDRINKETFISNLKEPDPFSSRKIKDLVIQRLEAGHANVSCIIIGETEAKGKRYFRNTRIFKKFVDLWQLQTWYN